MNEQDVTAVLAEAASQLTERANKALDKASIREQGNGPVEEVDGLIAAARVDLEASRRIRGLKTETPIRGRRGPKPGTANGASPVTKPGSSATAVPARTWPGN